MSQKLPIVGLTTGRNGEWDITGLSFWMGEKHADGSQTVFLDSLGRRGTVIERAGTSVYADVFVKEATKLLAKLGYKVIKDGEQ